MTALILVVSCVAGDAAEAICASDRVSASSTALADRPTAQSFQFDPMDGDGIWVVSGFIRDERLLAALASRAVWTTCPGVQEDVNAEAAKSEAIAGFGWWTGSRPQNVWEEVAQ